MKFEACSKEIYESKNGYYKPSNNLALLTAFTESEHECVKVVDHTWHDPNVGANSLRKSVKRYKIGSVRVFVRNGEIYLVKI